jgi:hypothetical protein
MILSVHCYYPTITLLNFILLCAFYSKYSILISHVPGLYTSYKWSVHQAYDLTSKKECLGTKPSPFPPHPSTTFSSPFPRGMVFMVSGPRLGSTVFLSWHPPRGSINSDRFCQWLNPLPFYPLPILPTVNLHNMHIKLL